MTQTDNKLKNFYIDLRYRKNVDEVLKFISDKYFNGNAVPVHETGYIEKTYVFISEITEGKYSIVQDFRNYYHPAILVYDGDNKIVDVQLKEHTIKVYAIVNIENDKNFYPNRHEELGTFFKNKHAKILECAKYTTNSKYLIWDINFDNWGFLIDPPTLTEDTIVLQGKLVYNEKSIWRELVDVDYTKI